MPVFLALSTSFSQPSFSALLLVWAGRFAGCRLLLVALLLAVGTRACVTIAEAIGTLGSAAASSFSHREQPLLAHPTQEEKVGQLAQLNILAASTAGVQKVAALKLANASLPFREFHIGAFSLGAALAVACPTTTATQPSTTA